MKKILAVVVLLMLISEFLAVGGVGGFPKDSVITVISPNGGEVLYGGEQIPIVWNTDKSGDIIAIYYSIDSGTNWTPITYIPNLDQFYIWRVPIGVKTTHARIKVVKRTSCSSGNVIGYDQSDADFTITPSVITLIAPNGGEIWISGQTYNIRWVTADSGGYVKIYYTGNLDDPYAPWKEIACVPNTGSYLWNIPSDFGRGSLGIEVRKVSDCKSDSSYYDTSDGWFYVTDSDKVITLTSPAKGDIWVAGETHNITWKTSTVGGYVHIFYTTASSHDWTTIACVPNNNITGTYNWHIPDTLITNYAKIIVSSNSGCGIEDSTYCETFADIMILPPVITLTSPNGGEVWHPGETHNITWKTGTAGDYVRIDYSTDSGNTWTKIDCVSNTGSYSWHIPDSVNTEHAKIQVSKVCDYSGSPSSYIGYDKSDTDFTIAPVITLTSPNGGEVWHPGETHNITWKTAEPGGSVSISYSVDSGSHWTNIDCVSNTGSYSWHIPYISNTTNARINIRKLDTCGSLLPEGYDTSDADFTITSSFSFIILLASPNGGEVWHPGETHNITWTTGTTGGYVNISFSTDSGSTWTKIDCVSNPGTTGSYSWKIPDGINTTHARIKVTKQSVCSGVTAIYGSDTSDADFTITTADTAPSAPSNLTANATSCNNVNLSWSDNSNNESVFKIERKESGSTYLEIATVPANTTTYADTTVQAQKTYYYRVRAYNASGNSSYTDEVNVTTPACGTPPNKPTNLSASSKSTTEINLSWTDNSDNEDGFKLERKGLGGAYTEIKTLAANTTSYSDTGLNANTTYYYRIRAYNSYGYSDYSNEANATTQKEVTIPNKPTNLQATAGSTTEIKLN